MNDIVQKVIWNLSSLPGISKKQAENLAYYLIKQEKETIDEIISSLIDMSNNIQNCIECGNISENEKCNICLSTDRIKKIIIVESPIDVFNFEKKELMKAHYHVLHGLVKVSKNSDFNDLNIQNLKERIKNFKEIIIALSPNLEGIVTSQYIQKLLKGKIKITQLAQGIPIGAAMDYVDEITLKLALENRKEVK